MIEASKELLGVSIMASPKFSILLRNRSIFRTPLVPLVEPRETCTSFFACFVAI